MNLHLPFDHNVSRRDWRGLLLLLIAVLLYLIGPVGINFDKKKARFPEEITWDTLVAGMGADPDCGINPRKSIFLMTPIDLNLADVGVLASLKGIGPELATRIVAYRDQKGKFSQVSDITGVRGIGPRKLAGFVDDVTVGKCAE